MIRTRFAPSPTGFLHIGGARTTLYNWLFARRHRGTFVLRVEDTDEARSTEDSVTAILDSIRWLGLDWDEGPLPMVSGGGTPSPETPGSGSPVDLGRDRGPYGPYYQMKRIELYQKHVRQLALAGLVYPCYCAKEELDAMRKAAVAQKRPAIYDGRCRKLTDRQKAEHEASGRKPSWRFSMPKEGETAVDDLIRGRVSFDNRLLQDLVVQKAAGGPTYNFACVVDDHHMAITHVIRGDEHLSNTPSQLQLYAALGWEAPKFAHLSMILGPDGSKLSKRHGAASVLEYKAAGFLPAAMRNYLGLLGWSTTDSRQLFFGDELVEAFDLAGCQKNPAVFDQAKLTWMNGEHLRKLGHDELMRHAEPFLEAAGLVGPLDPPLDKTVALEGEKCRLLADIPGRVDFFYKDVEFTEKAMAGVLKRPGVKEMLLDVAGLLEAAQPFAEKALEEKIRGYCEARALKTSQVFHPLRAALSGRTEGPTLFGMIEALGRGKSVGRLRAAAALL
ncbi:MAG: glutamate--tRNA ligase [Elusimicrobia bacterium]|nr:glutamate--tRNA ligase [Elusimicrobiota bacterium]